MKTETKHTPGPWCVWDSQQGHGPTVIQGAAPDYSQPFRGVAITAPYLAPAFGEQLANAHLIAAAPRLLEALQECAIALHKAQRYGPPEHQANILCALESAQAAIAATEGRGE